MKKTAILIMVSILALSLVACTMNDSNNTTPNNNISTSPSREPDNQTASLASAERLGFEGGNIGAGGLVCGGDDGYIYYRSESDGWSLYKAKSDGSEKSKISGHVPSCINVLDDWVYFLDYRDNFSIYRVRTNGTEEIKLVDGYCSNLYIAESGMHFDMCDEQNVSNIYCADLDGGNMTLLFPDASLMYYYKDKIYLGTAQLGVYDIETGDEKILAQTYIANVSVDDSGIYYWAVDEGEFRNMDFNGSGESVILKGGNYFNYSEDNLYYMGISENQNGPCHVIDRLNITLNETTTLLAEANEYFNAHGELIGVTFMQFNESPETIDPKLLVPNAQGEIFIGYSEAGGYVYTSGDHLYMRCTLPESIIITGKADCLVRLDDGVTVWD